MLFRAVWYYEMVKMLASPCYWDEDNADYYEPFLVVLQYEMVKMLASLCYWDEDNADY